MTEDIQSNIASPVIIREELGGLTYEGRSTVPFPNTADEVWQIKRVVRVGPMSITEYAMENNAEEQGAWHNNQIKKNCVWDNRSTYFSAPPTPNETVIVDDPVPSGATYSDPIDVRGMIGCAFHAIWGPAPSGGGSFLSLEASIDGTTWADIPDSEKEIADSDDYLWNIRWIYYNYIRVKFNYAAIIQTKIYFSSR